MLHACAARFDVTGNLEKFWELNKAINISCLVDVSAHLFFFFLFNIYTLLYVLYLTSASTVS